MKPRYVFIVRHEGRHWMGPESTIGTLLQRTLKFILQLVDKELLPLNQVHKQRCLIQRTITQIKERILEARKGHIYTEEIAQRLAGASPRTGGLKRRVACPTGTSLLMKKKYRDYCYRQEKYNLPVLTWDEWYETKYSKKRK